MAGRKWFTEKVEMHEKTFDPWILSSLQLMGFVEVSVDTEAGVIFGFSE